MGLFDLFSKKKKAPAPSEAVYEYTFKKCRGYIGGRFEDFYAITAIKEPKIPPRGAIFGCHLPPSHKGLDVHVVLDGALRGKRVNLGASYKILAVSADQGDSKDGPYLRFETLHDKYAKEWQAAIFSLDEMHPVFAPLRPSLTDVTYGLVSYYEPEGGSYDGEDHIAWLERQAKGDGTQFSAAADSLFATIRPLFSKTGADPDEVDWVSHRRFFVRGMEGRKNCFAFIVTKEESTKAYDYNGQPIQQKKKP